VDWRVPEYFYLQKKPTVNISTSLKLAGLKVQQLHGV
jgi:hypothetical protein